eukprot:15326823-Ditylum_brightwellii.AAC.1
MSTTSMFPSPIKDAKVNNTEEDEYISECNVAKEQLFEKIYGVVAADTKEASAEVRIICLKNNDDT